MLRLYMIYNRSLLRCTYFPALGFMMFPRGHSLWCAGLILPVAQMHHLRYCIVANTASARMVVNSVDYLSHQRLEEAGYSAQFRRLGSCSRNLRTCIGDESHPLLVGLLSFAFTVHLKLLQAGSDLLLASTSHLWRSLTVRRFMRLHTLCSWKHWSQALSNQLLSLTKKTR